MLTQECPVTCTRSVAPQSDPSGETTDASHALTILLLILLSATARPSASARSSWQSTQTDSAMVGWSDTHVHLTARELDVLRLVARGLTNAEIGTRLYISRRTVEQHLCSLYNKLGVSTRTAATHFAFQHHLC
jgi:DNA-binding NarL/FixJ family response regulator